jgi:hypothetical protein
LRAAKHAFSQNYGALSMIDSRYWCRRTERADGACANPAMEENAPEMTSRLDAARFRVAAELPARSD